MHPKIIEADPGPSDHRKDDLVPVLGDWHANLIRIAKSPIVLCVNDFSLLTILVPGRDFPNFVSAFQSRLAGRLARMGLSADQISAERAAMEIIQIQPSNSRSVLASMNDFVRHLKWDPRSSFDFAEADALEDQLSETPMGALKYQYAVEVASAAFSLPPIQLVEKEILWKKAESTEDDLRPRYVLPRLQAEVRGKHVERNLEVARLVLLDPDIAAAFPDAKAVNDALRSLLREERKPH